jgi:hypothetical protein
MWDQQFLPRLGMEVLLCLDIVSIDQESLKSMTWKFQNLGFGSFKNINSCFFDMALIKSLDLKSFKTQILTKP